MIQPVSCNSSGKLARHRVGASSASSGEGPAKPVAGLPSPHRHTLPLVSRCSALAATCNTAAPVEALARPQGAGAGQGLHGRVAPLTDHRAVVPEGQARAQRVELRDARDAQVLVVRLGHHDLLRPAHGLQHQRLPVLRSPGPPSDHGAVAGTFLLLHTRGTRAALQEQPSDTLTQTSSRPSAAAVGSSRFSRCSILSSANTLPREDWA